MLYKEQIKKKWRKNGEKKANKKGKGEKFLKQAQRRAKAGRSQCSRAKCDAGQSVTEVRKGTY